LYNNLFNLYIMHLYIKICRKEGMRNWKANMKIHNRETSIKRNHHLPRSDNIAEVLHQRKRVSRRLKIRNKTSRYLRNDLGKWLSLSQFISLFHYRQLRPPIQCGSSSGSSTSDRREESRGRSRTSGQVAVPKAEKWLSRR